MQISLVFLWILFFIDNSPLDRTYLDKTCVQPSLDFYVMDSSGKTPSRGRSCLFSHKIPHLTRKYVHATRCWVHTIPKKHYTYKYQKALRKHIQGWVCMSCWITILCVLDNKHVYRWQEYMYMYLSCLPWMCKQPFHFLVIQLILLFFMCLAGPFLYLPSHRQ